MNGPLSGVALNGHRYHLKLLDKRSVLIVSPTRSCVNQRLQRAWTCKERAELLICNPSSALAARVRLQVHYYSDSL